ncbi:alpha-ketoglutarate-dependent dioxygenase alkB homolog 7, mitochondrial-like [Haliotis rufescens]|uniref:alpha-ketoglutarate-dependent dioxygenase alkB homolog 7, mitochondrial-like n=1 Tax=Haliotis rufescens TaxID=6454 RepID=UPI001EAFCA28|nr:alpha-ketoglutarate-dependent dioxygenase alkB homolog 7, mitochondrial-like [Haliotis rufescens]XP_048255620.1 alpha-ketoglutarate-dependent dioxygenase alkB homolog 7, mitochondrial-like [Haliotis rufescens]XP_048255621.1 alpha-ketoglutarate-dependent dioxygenase alkB homolog 7, mitochondrial-like [Haliotis rufescens]
MSTFVSPAIRCALTQSVLRSWCKSRRHLVVCGSLTSHYGTRNRSTAAEEAKPFHRYLDASDAATEDILARDMIIHEDFLSAEEEKSLLDEVEPYMKRLRYEHDHWDDAIHGYRETERRKWNERNMTILQRVKDLAFPPGTPQLAYIHILDISKEGYIKPHVDAVRFCGNTIAGLNLLSSAVMKLVHEKDKDRFASILLRQRSLYIMKDSARYDYTHEVLPESQSRFRGQVIPRDRRMSIICRNEPLPEHTSDS